MNRSESKFLFIVGHYKSGSTWLMRMLATHPQVRMLNETHLFQIVESASSFEQTRRELMEFLPGSIFQSTAAFRFWTRSQLRRLVYDRRYRFCEHRPYPHRYLPVRKRNRMLRLMEDATSPEQLCQIFLTTYASHLGNPEFLAEKSPDHIFNVPLIRRTFPDARLLAVYRDVRDVIGSARAFTGRDVVWNLASARTVEEEVHNWKHAIELQNEYVSDGSLLAVRYEDLLISPQEQLRKVFEYCQLDSGSDVISSCVNSNTFKKMSGGRSRGQENARAFFRKGVAGDWKNTLTSDECETVQRIAGELLATLQYSDGEADAG